MIHKNCETRVNVGDVLTMSVPFGAVVLDDAAGHPTVFASAGIGITPMAGMLSHLAKAGSHLPIMLLHADHDEDSFALRGQVLADIAALPGASVYTWYEQGGSRLPVTGVFPGEMDISQIDLPDNAIYHLCGRHPVHARSTHSLDQERCFAPGHSIRGLRPRPVAGRLRIGLRSLRLDTQSVRRVSRHARARAGVVGGHL